MKKTKIIATTMAFAMLTGVMAAGCKDKETSAASLSSETSDTGLSIEFNPNEPTTVSTAIPFTYENNYDQAAIDLMNRVVTIHDMTFSKFEYNYYWVNEYVTIYQMYLQSPDSVPMTGAGFIDVNAHVTDDQTVGDYLTSLTISDLQGEVYLLEYAEKYNLTLDAEVEASIDETLEETRKTAEGYGITLDEYLQSYYGPDATEAAMREIMQRYELVNTSMKHFVENYKFEEGEDQLPIVYHVLYATMDITTGLELDEAAQNEAKSKAEAFESTITTYDDLKTKAVEAKTAGDVLECAEYTVNRGEMVTEFEDWCFEKHEVGDTGIVKSEYGYHVMYFVGTRQADEDEKKTLIYYQLQMVLAEALEGGEYAATFAD